jgi:hypothetical protein
MSKPTVHQVLEHVMEHYGLTRAQALVIMRTPLHPHDLRDEFAGCALAGLCAGPDSYTSKELAVTSYQIADEMLAARLPKET